MKKLLMMIVLGASCVVSAGEVLSVKDNPPKDGTPEALAVKYVKLLIEENKNEVKKHLMDGITKSFFNDKVLDKKIIQFKTWELNKTFTYKVHPEKNGKTPVSIGSVIEKTGTGFQMNFKMHEGKWMITF